MIKGDQGGHKIGKMGRRRLWMVPNAFQDFQNEILFHCLNLLQYQGELW